MKAAKFLLWFLVGVVIVLVLALVIVWGLSLKLGQRGEVGERLLPRTYTVAERDEIIASLGNASSSLYISDSASGELKLTEAGKRAWAELQAAPRRTFTAAERQRILESVNKF